MKKTPVIGFHKLKCFLISTGIFVLTLRVSYNVLAGAFCNGNSLCRIDYHVDLVDFSRN